MSLSMIDPCCGRFRARSLHRADDERRDVERAHGLAELEHELVQIAPSSRAVW